MIMQQLLKFPPQAMETQDENLDPHEQIPSFDISFFQIGDEISFVSSELP